MFNQRALPVGATPELLPCAQVANTLAGNLESKRKMWLEDLVFPEFGKTKRVKQQDALVFNQPNCPCAVTAGNDLLTAMGLTLNFADKTITWMDFSVPMKGAEFWDDPIQTYLALDEEEEHPSEQSFDNYVTALKEAKCEKVSPDEVAKQQTHLTEEQQQKLASVLRKHDKLFSGTLGCYPHMKVHLEVQPGAKPVHSRPHAVPKVNKEVFKK